MSFLWRILSEVGLYTVCPYDDEAAVSARGPDDPPHELDPIEVAGCCRTSVIRKFATELHADFGIRATDLTQDVSSIWKENREPYAISHHRATSIKYYKHMDDLEDAHIVQRQRGTAGLLYINGYSPRTLPTTEPS